MTTGRQRLYGNEETATLTIKVPTSLKTNLQKMAQNEVRSVGAQAVFLIKKGLAKQAACDNGVSAE